MFSPLLNSISGLGHLVIALFCLVAFGSLYSSWKKNKNEMLKNFMFMFIFVAIFMALMGLMDYLIALNRDLVIEQSLVPSLVFAFAHIFMILALSFYVKIPFRVLMPRLEKTGFWITIGTGLVSVVIAFVNPIFPTVQAGITHYNVGVPFSASIGIWGFIFIAGLGGIFFLYQALKTKERFMKIRSVVLGIGFLLWVVGGPLHDFAKTTKVYLFADALLLLSFMVILFGIYMKRFLSAQDRLIY